MQRKEVGLGVGVGGVSDGEQGGGVETEQGEGRMRRFLLYTHAHSQHARTHMHVVRYFTVPPPSSLCIPLHAAQSYDPRLHLSSENKDPFHHFLFAGKQEM